MEFWRAEVLDKYGAPRPILVNMDTAEAHIADSTILDFASRGYLVNPVPPDCTGLIQPLDTHINRPFRDAYWNQMNKLLSDSMDQFGDLSGSSN